MITPQRIYERKNAQTTLSLKIHRSKLSQNHSRM